MRVGRKLAKRVLSLGLALALSVAVAPAGAAPAPSNLAAAQRQAAAARTKLASMRGELASGMNSYTAASSGLAQTRTQIAANTKRLAQVQAQLDRNQRSLDSQARFLYRTGGAGFVDVLLGASTFEQFASRLSVLTDIAAADAGLVATLKNQRAETERLRTGLKQREAKQATQLAAVTSHRRSVQGSISKQQAYLSSLSSQVQTLVDQQEASARAVSASNGSSGGSIHAPKPTQGMPSSGSTSLAKATILGQAGSWTVMASEPRTYRSTGVVFNGVATQYSESDNGGTGTSSGRPLNDGELTCASRTLPFGTRLAISRGSNRLIVVVTDRGPFTPGRILDLTITAGRLVGIDGVGSVHCEIVEAAK